MIRSRLFWEILPPYAAFVLVVAAAMIWVGGTFFQRAVSTGETVRIRTVAQAAAVHDEWFVTPAEQWREELNRLANETDARLIVIDGHGAALADTDGPTLDDFDDRPEIRQARDSGTGEAALGGNRVAVAIAVRSSQRFADLSSDVGSDDRPLLGFIRAEGTIRRVDAAVTRWRRWATAFAAVAGVIGLIWIGRTTFRIAAPIETIVRSAASVSGFGESLPSLRAGRRLAPLSSALDDLANRLSEQVEHLRRDNASLATHSERLSAVLTGMAEGVLAVDRQERILFTNPAAAHYLDLPDGKLVGRPLWESVRVSAIQDAARQARERGQTQRVEIELPRTQTILALQASCLPGEPSPGVVLVLHDVTELRRLETMRRDFVGNVSHELKTPLAAIQAYTETLLDGGIDDRANNVKFLKRIDEQTERLHHLILDLLRLARIEAGTDVFEITRLTAGKIIEPCVEEHLAIARSKGVVLQTFPPAVPVRLRADPDGLRTILDNLLDNAINYTPAGGRVMVRWDRQGDTAVIEIADTGIGIPEEHLPRIFERFHRVDQARSREHGGTGLGLAIVKHLVQVFDGRVEVESEVGRGSTFRVLLPLA
ncbi:MAG: ATP-binding protein [Planctomycetaceae bacterium]